MNATKTFPNADRAGRIRVKLMAKSLLPGGEAHWLRWFPAGKPSWGACDFIFDQNCSDYDWLLIYDDLPSRSGERFPLYEERLACPREHTLLVTTEPSSIKVYGRAFLRQFGHVLTSQERWAIKHPGAIFAQPGLIPFYGVGERGSYDTLAAQPLPEKTAPISTVCSSKQQTHTLHKKRYEFTQRLRAALPELEVFGHGVRPIADKADALDAYRYHIAIENHLCPHHWTEKLSDCFLGYCLPIYHGCPNAQDYFPADSFIRININRFDEALARIRAALRDDEYTRRLPAILEARRLVLERYGFFPNISALIASLHSAAVTKPDQFIMSRHLLRRRRPLTNIGLLAERAWLRLRNASSRIATPQG